MTVFTGTHQLTLHEPHDSSLYPTLVMYTRNCNELYAETVTGLFVFHCSWVYWQHLTRVLGTAVALTNARTDNVHSSPQPLCMYSWTVLSNRHRINFSHISILSLHHHLPTSLDPMQFIPWTSAGRYTKSTIYIKFFTMNIHNAVQSGTMVHGHFLSEEHITSTLNPLALELDIYIVAHLLYKMWIFYVPKQVTLWNTRHSVEE